VQWRQNAKLLEAMGIWNEVAFNLSDGRTAERIEGAAVTYDFPVALGIRPVLGRMFTANEDKPKGPPVVLIGEGLWRERFGGSQDVLGRTLKLNGVAHTIIGVLPRSARGDRCGCGPGCCTGTWRSSSPSGS
jgi:putative ABC transport system permease protein